MPKIRDIERTDIVDLLGLRTLTLGSLSIARNNAGWVVHSRGDAVRLLSDLLLVRHDYIMPPGGFAIPIDDLGRGSSR